MTQTLLIPESAPLIIRQRTGRRGRGSTAPVVQELTADRPNPAGRRVMTIRFRPLERHWDAIRDPFERRPKSRWRVALNLLWEHFQLIGGFRVADDALVRIVADAFEAYPPDHILWAIRAKAASLTGADPVERREKRVFVPRPEKFYEPRSLDYWIEQSPEGRAAAAERDSRALADKLDALRFGPAGAAASPPANDGPAHAPSVQASLDPALPAAIQLAISDQARNTALVELLTERRRRIAERALEQDRRDYQWWFDQVAGDEYLTKIIRQHVLTRIALERWPHLRRAYAELGRGAADDHEDR